MQKNSNLKLRSEPKQPVQLNKPVVLTVAATIVLAVLLGVINAFNTAPSAKRAKDQALKVSREKPLARNSELEELPSSYRDVANIRKYAPEGEQNIEVARLQQQVDSLKNAYLLLEQQLHRASQRTAPEPVAIDPLTQRARESSLVFPGMEGKVDNLVGGRGPQRPGMNQPFRRPGQGEDKDLVATPEQEKLFREQADNARKIALMKGVDRPEDTLSLHPEIKPIAPNHQLLRGTIIPVTLISSIDTTIPGTVIAQVRRNIYDSVSGKYLLVPMGSKLLGQYGGRVGFGQNRVTVIFTSLMRPNGSSIVLDRPIAYDLQGKAGIVSKVDNHWGKVLGTAAIATALSVGAAMAGGSYNTENQSVKSRIAVGAANAISGVGQNLALRAMSVPPTITVDAGSQFNIILSKDIVLSPYKTNS